MITIKAISQKLFIPPSNYSQHIYLIFKSKALFEKVAIVFLVGGSLDIELHNRR